MPLHEITYLNDDSVSAVTLAHPRTLEGWYNPCLKSRNGEAPLRLPICESWKIAIDMITVNDFRQRILDRELDWLVDEVLLSGPAAHVEAPEIAYIRASLA